MFLLNFFAHYLPPQRYNFFFIYPNKTSKTVKLFLITLKIFVYMHFLRSPLLYFLDIIVIYLKVYGALAVFLKNEHSNPYARDEKTP